MSRLAIALTTLLAASTASAQTEWLETSHNFGAFSENDGNVSCVFRFVNRGDEPVGVVSVRTSCGCTTADIPRHDIMPGDTAVITAVYNPTGRPGRFEKKIVVETTDTPSKTQLMIYGTVIGSAATLHNRYPVDGGDIRLRGTIVAFGNVTKGTLKNDFIEVCNVSDDTLTPQWERVPKHLRIVSVDKTIPPGQHLAYSMLYDSKANSGYGLVADTIFLRPRPGAEPVAVEVIANLSEDFSRLSESDIDEAPQAFIEQPTLDFGTFSPYATAAGRFTIANRGKRPLQIRRIYSADKGVDISYDSKKIKRGRSLTVRVMVEPQALHTEMLNARVIVITNDPVNPVQTVRLVGLTEKTDSEGAPSPTTATAPTHPQPDISGTN